MASQDFRQSILEHVDGFNRDAQLVGQLLDNKTESPQSRPDYFYLTDLVNPQGRYWDHQGLSPEYSEEQQRLFAHGNRMEAVARKAFSQIEGFSEAEATLDGAENGLPGIRGKVDFRYTDSLVEFKTSEFDIETGDDVWNLAPQDIEQLLFYSVLWAYDSETHYLIYHLGDGPSSLRVFEVTIEAAGTLKTILRSRKADLSHALDTEDPSILGKCRYHDHTCQIGVENVCGCSDLQEIDTLALQDATAIRRDTQFEETLIEALRRNETEVSPVRSWDLYTPRQWFGREFGEQERSGDFLTPEWVHQALDSANITPGPLTDIEAPRIDQSVRYFPRVRFVERTRTTNRGVESEWVPARVVAKEWETPREPRRLQNQFMQVACAAAAGDLNRGLLIVEMPNSGAEVDVIELRFHDPSGIARKIRDRLNRIGEAVRDEDPSVLPECPDWVQGFGCEHCLCD